jgi:hypothetical protein
MLGGYKMIRQKLFSGKGLAWLGLAQAGSALLHSIARKLFSRNVITVLAAATTVVVTVMPISFLPGKF